MKGPLDVVFCRNVVIYFDKDTQRGLFGRMAQATAPAIAIPRALGKFVQGLRSYELIGKPCTAVLT